MCVCNEPRFAFIASDMITEQDQDPYMLENPFTGNIYKGLNSHLKFISLNAQINLLCHTKDAT